jgi:hypothetical protein
MEAKVPKTVLFVPFTLEEDPNLYQDEFNSWPINKKNSKWISRAQKKFGANYPDGPSDERQVVQAFYREGQKSPELVGLGVHDQVYVRGHSRKGHGKVFSKEVGKNELDGAEVGQRLIDSGLEVDFAGKLKCYSCWGAYTMSTSDFAQGVADYLWSRSFRSCQFYGYRGSLSSFPGANDHDPAFPKLRGHKEAVLDDGSHVRAKDARVRVFPSALLQDL